MAEKTYTKENLSVIWKPGLCIHSANCVQGLPAVFDNTRRPWIDLEQGEKEAIITQVGKCPSGALSYSIENEKIMNNPEEKKVVQVTAIPNGPLQVNTTCEIQLPNGEIVLKPEKSFFCRCGNSTNKPFCDGSHKKAGFTG
ncbi:MAG: hypothetical protein HKN76_21260 [Saprospiraceae bacterium]|nr:hypothetical protein [Saprospiraceae bacterium]